MENQSFSETRKLLQRAGSLAAERDSRLRAAIDAVAGLDAALRTEAAQKTAELTDALTGFSAELARPVVRVAATGATSSAKSSLLNFLCGEELLPTDAQEKSAGATRVRDAEKPALFVRPTEGAVWATGGVAVNSAAEIRAGLEEAMDRYREETRAGRRIAAPEFVVEYPLRARALLDLPRDFDLEALDLPGLRHVGDERDREIMAECRDSLCVVTFGAHETDPIKQEAVLDAVMESVDLIGAPLERMFFVATRVDEFLLKTPDGWPRNEKRFLEDRRQAIAERLAERYGPGASASLARLSPLPALLALQLFDETGARKAWKRLSGGFLGLVQGGRGGDPYEGVDTELMGKFAQWSDAEKTEVFNQIWDTAGAADFLAALKERLTANLPAVILPPATARYAEATEDAVEWLERKVAELKIRVRGDAERAIGNLERALKEQEEICAKAAAALETFVREWLTLVIRNSFYGDYDAEGWRLLWKKFPDFNSPALRESERWGFNIESAYLKPAESAREWLARGKALPDSLPRREELASALLELIRRGYGPGSLKGVSGLIADEKSGALPGLFNKFIDLCQEIADLNSDRAAEALLARILACLEGIQNDFIAYLNEQNRSLPPESRAAAVITRRGLSRFARRATRSGKGVGTRARQWEKIEEVSRKVSNLTGNFLINLWRRATGNATKIIRDRVKTTIVSLPPYSTVLVDFKSVFRDQIPRRLAVVDKQIMEKTAEFSGNIAAYRTSLIESFRDSLKKSVGEKMANARAAERVLDEADASSRAAREELDELKNLYKADAGRGDA